jgi:hypothetical protein
METSTRTYFVRSDNVTEKPVGEDVALYVGARRAIHVPNATARFIWESLREPLTFDELLFILGEAFDVDHAVLRKDLEDTLDLFAKSELLMTETRIDGPPLP